MRTQVGIVGAGPAGLMLSHLLHLSGIESVVLEARSRKYVEERLRAGVLEQSSVDLLLATGLGDRLKELGLVRHAIHLNFAGARHRINFDDLTPGRCIMIYGQQEIVKDLIQARLNAGGEIQFEVSDVSLHGIETANPSIEFRDSAGNAQTLNCDFIAGCDGTHGVSRAAIPPGVLQIFERVFPFAWLGVLSETPSTSDEPVYSYHERGFALYNMRTPQTTRLYLQCSPEEDLAQWPDDRIWEELCIRHGTRDGWMPATGPILQKGVTGMRSLVVEPMQHGRLFLAGDAAHIVPPTGAKGMNLAIADVRVLSKALEEYYAAGRTDLLSQYSPTCLRRVWNVQRFAWWMTSMLHRAKGDDGFDHRRQLAELDYVTGSRPASMSLAENYVGLPVEG